MQGAKISSQVDHSPQAQLGLFSSIKSVLLLPSDAWWLPGAPCWTPATPHQPCSKWRLCPINMPESYGFLKGLLSGFNYLLQPGIKALANSKWWSRPSLGKALDCSRNLPLNPLAGLPVWKVSPSSSALWQVLFLERPVLGRGTGQLLSDAGVLGTALLLPTRGQEVGEPVEESNCCCWRNLPEAQRQHQVLSLSPAMCRGTTKWLSWTTNSILLFCLKGIWLTVVKLRCQYKGFCCQESLAADPSCDTVNM